jgi:SPP1 family predicted phage head-tail adaptor
MLPKKLSTGVRYLGASAYNTPVTFLQPNAGQAADGTPLPATVVKRTRANVNLWRGKEEEKTQERVGISSYKVIIRFPIGWTVDTGMQIQMKEQLLDVESVSDPDMQKRQLEIWAWTTDATYGKGTA